MFYRAPELGRATPGPRLARPILGGWRHRRRTGLEDAHQVDSLAPMLAQRPIFAAVSVGFETITNHETLWTITP
jgi:hypothetical protein